ncbi:MAG: imelysin family protein [Chitinophagaceae bacterium]
MKSAFKYGLFVVVMAIGVYACSKSSSSGGGDTNPSSNDAFKTTMLTNYADNLIIPAYTDFQTKLTALETVVNNFLNTPSSTTLDAVKPVFKDAYLSFERISMPFLGPASSLAANSYINTFPAVASKIESGIQSGSYDFTITVVSDSIQGLPALDYLLFSSGAVNKFSASDAANRKKYVRDVLARIKSLTQNISNQWNNGYRAVFIASLKTDVGSSIGLLVNQFALEMDKMKGPRIGWPFGKQSNGIVFADKCEGYYAGFSAALAVENLSSLKNYYTGGSASGIDDYLVLLKKDQLNKDVLAQFDIAINSLKAIPDPLSAAFTNNAALVDEAYKQVQKLLTLLKTDVASATAVQINYMDNDGD